MKVDKYEQTVYLYEFGHYRLNTRERTLSGDEGTIALPPKVFDTLVLLLENSGHALSKEELIQQLWPDSFVEEGNLTHYISQLRKVLGDSISQPQYIETLPKHGYRFIAPVRTAFNNQTSKQNFPTVDLLNTASENKSESSSFTIPEQENITASSTQPFLGQPPSAINRSLRLPAIILIVTITIIAWLIYLIPTKLSKQISFPEMKISKLTTHGRISHAAISPDGKYIVYSQQENDKSSLSVRQTNSTSGLNIL
ncbi:MAG: transcriptional regulator, partial [Acidobacteriota bacterium]